MIPFKIRRVGGWRLSGEPPSWDCPWPKEAVWCQVTPSVRGSPHPASCQQGGQRRAIPAPPQCQVELPRPLLCVTAVPVPSGCSLCTVLLLSISPRVLVPRLSLTELLHKKLHGFCFLGHQPEAHPEPMHRKKDWKHCPKMLT